MLKEFKTIHHTVEQNTDEWFNMRLGKITSSNFDKIMANFGKPFGNPAVEYARKIALERITGSLDESCNYNNQYMERGNELEPLAIMAYEESFFTNVENGGFFEKGFLGDSPDGLIGNDGCIEIKSVIPNTQWKRVESEKPDTGYKYQVQGHLFVSGRSWCDFVSFCPEFKGKELITFRIEKDLEMFEKMETRLFEFNKLVQSKINIAS